ncbi:GNAT family N-acetyltransferase [Solibacillus sp. CAU 1738]|uniref:GNAT family N-acetyltransferase n=1 Tax=Solibacillus sp. CAU 1738 TaxID=3140363 RepID=UPI003261227C
MIGMNMDNLFSIDCGEIYLREFSIDDVDAIYELTSQPEVYEFLQDWRSTREQRLHWMTNDEIPNNKKFIAAVPNVSGVNCLMLGIILKETGDFIGFCNTCIKEELNEPNREIAYAISKNFRNKGYTTKAAKGLIDYLFENTNVELLNTVVLPHNVSSNQVIKKCGFRYRGDIEIEDQTHYHYTLNKEDWKKQSRQDY